MSSRLTRLGSLLLTPLWLFVLHPIWRSRAKKDSPWVIGGHRGRAYADNSAALEKVARAAAQPIVWIGNEALCSSLREEGVAVFLRGSWAARRAISQAPALIYSHGEDDLDIFMLLLRGRTNARIYLNHSLNLLKGGGVTEPALKSAPYLLRKLKTWLITDCDMLLCVSEQEKRNFELAYPHLLGKIHLGGGAHLDEWVEKKEHRPKKRIYWFPTFRESSRSRQALSTVIEQVCSSERLRAWLNENEYEFYLGAHINSFDADPSSPSTPLALLPPFYRASLSEVASEVSESELLISDYSGMIFDFLLLDRPVVLFAFDLDEYQETRYFFSDYAYLDFAPQPRSVDELVELLISCRFRSEGYQLKAVRYRETCFPPETAPFALRSLEAVRRHLDQSS